MIKLVNTPSFYSSLYEVADFCLQNSKDEIYIIVPDKLTLFMEKFIFEQMNTSASFNIKVSSLNRFAKKHFAIDKQNLITNAGSIILINKILDEHYAEFSIFKNKAYSFSYAENILSTINQLRASNITYQMMQGFSCKNEQLTNKIKDLQLIYEYYENGKAGKLDAAEMFLASALNISKNLGKEKFVFVGFDDFTAIEYSIIEMIAQNNEINIFNYKSKGNNKHIFNNEIYEQLKNIANKSVIGFEYLENEKKYAPLKDFLHNNLFGIKNEKYLLNDEEKIAIISGNGVDSELEFVARNIRHKVIDGEKFSNFGVAVYNLDAKISKIKEIFEKYEINYYIDNQFTLNKSVFYKFIVSILKYSLNGYDIVNLIDIINSPFFVLEETEKQKLTERLMFFNFGKIDKLNLGQEFDNSKNLLIEFLSCFDLKKTTKIEEFVKQTKNADEKLGFKHILDDLASNRTNLTEKIMLEKSNEMMYNLLDDIVSFYPTANLEKLYDVIVHISALVKFNNLPLTLDAVKIVDAENTMEIFENLYIVNCTSETAPSLKFDCGIILDDEIAQLNFKLSPTIAHINKLAKLRLYNLAMMFEKSLTITYSNNQSDLIKELTSKIEILTDYGKDNLPVTTNYSAKEYLAMSKWDLIEYLCKNDKKNLELLKNVNKNKEFLQISTENLKIFANFNKISASQLENYFKCPFNYFLNSILKIKERTTNDVSSIDVGNIIHNVLFEYYNKNKNVGDVRAFVKTKLESYLQNDEHLKLNANSPTITNLLEELIRIIDGLNYIDKNSLYEPYKFEYEFAGKNALQLKNISLVGKVDRIDKYNEVLRVIDYKSGLADASLKELFYGNKLQLFLYACAVENLGKVVGEFYLPLHNDYKKAESNPYALKGFYINDEQLVHALDVRLQPQQSSDIANIYLTSKMIAKKYDKQLKAGEMDNLKEYAKKVSENAVDEIRSGYIATSPNKDSKICSFCPYVHICMRATNNIKLRKTDDVKLESFKSKEDNNG